MASKQLNYSLACPTQVVLEYETRCLNVKLLIFLALHSKTQKSLETQRGRSKCVTEGEGDGEGNGDGEGEEVGDGDALINGERHEIPRSKR
jgi:hypothetical protein